MDRYRFYKGTVLFILMAATWLAVGCGNSVNDKPAWESAPMANDDGKRLKTETPTGSPDDSTVYALAATGTNDSILVFLKVPYQGADPDTVDILEARSNHQIFGKPEVGDNVAILLNDSDQTLAERVIVTEKLVGRWCFEVYPRQRRKLGEGPPPPRLQKMLEEKREYGIVIKLSGEVLSMGAHARQADEQLPVVYPLAKNYGRWHIFNGRLVLSELKRGTGNDFTIIGSDTADFIRLKQDTLILGFNDGERKFYRKEEDE